VEKKADDGVVVVDGDLEFASPSLLFSPFSPSRTSRCRSSFALLSPPLSSSFSLSFASPLSSTNPLSSSSLSRSAAPPGLRFVGKGFPLGEPRDPGDSDNDELVEDEVEAAGLERPAGIP
jgi:hypothetical protein